MRSMAKEIASARMIILMNLLFAISSFLEIAYCDDEIRIRVPGATILL